MTQENKMLNKALFYLSLGWSVIPVRPDKRPMFSWAVYQDRLPTEQEVRDWWGESPNAGIGIITGSISELVVLDLDLGYDPTKIRELNLPPTASVRTPSGGQHIYFRHPGHKLPNRADLFGNASHVDVRADGGYVVAPPSLSLKGVQYSWMHDIQETSIAELPRNLIDLITKKNERGALPKEAVARSLFNGVPEGSRNSEAAKIAGTLLKKYTQDKWEQSVWPELKVWNEKNIPPLDEDELKIVYESISKRESGSTESTKELDGAIKLSELLNKSFGFPNWAIDHFFETGTVNMISAAPNQYKSWIVHHMAISIASGKPVFDKFPVSKQGVLIVNEEDTERQLKERSLMLLTEDKDLLIYFHVAKGIKIDGPFVEKILAEMKSKNLTFLVLDSLRSLHNSDENNSKEMQMIMDQLKRFSKEGITVLFTHHNRKKFRGFGGDSDQGGNEESRGSSSINAAIHGHISCEPKKDGDKQLLIIAQHKLKSDKKMDPIKVLIREDEQSPKMSFIYEGEYDGKVESRNKVGDEIKAELLSSGWMSVKDLSDRDLGAERVVREALRVLVHQNTIVSKKRQDLLAEGIELKGRGKGTELFYSLPTRNYEQDF